MDFETYVLNSITDTFYDDVYISITNLFEADDLFFSKDDAMKSESAYLCDVFSNGYSICDDHFMHMFDINSVQTESFNLGTCADPKNILISSNLTLDERIQMEEILKKREKYFAWGYEDMP